MPPIFRIILRILPLYLKRLGGMAHGNVGLSWSLLARRSSALLQSTLAETCDDLAESEVPSPHPPTFESCGQHALPTPLRARGHGH
jgi:hypothetical protein